MNRHTELVYDDAAVGYTPIVRPGRNCWRIDRADRMLCIQDAADYFRLVRRAMLSAQRSLFLLGWDTSGPTDLLPGEHPGDGPTRLDELLAYVARRRPTLDCRVLTWDYGIVHLLERDPFTRWRLSWRMPSNVTFAFDDHHAVGGCHHQKVVVVDDQLAFSGGIDLTGHRWDTSAHRVDEPSRISLGGSAYPPYHEVQAMVSGPAAAALGALARDRWLARGVDGLPPVEPSRDDLWPSDVRPDLTNAPVAIARTMPGLDGQPAIRECETLYIDSITRARRAIYIESQYFTDDRLASALAARLQEPDGPEIIVVMPKSGHGWAEQTTMDALRDQVSRQLIAADAYRRLRLVYPAASQSRDVPTFVHSKVMFVDDQLARIGSANLSKRSMGVDSECDVAVDAGGDIDLAAGILRMRNRMIAEHLGIATDDLAREIETGQSLRAIVDAHASGDHTLVRVPIPATPEPPPAELVAVADPDEPIADMAVAAAMPGQLKLAIVAAVLAALAVVYAWRSGWPLSWAQAGTGAMALILVFGALRAWLFARRVSRIRSRHRREAEFR